MKEEEEEQEAYGSNRPSKWMINRSKKEVKAGSKKIFEGYMK